jgi:hypothetical protein
MILQGSMARAGDDRPWRVSKSSGDVWTVSPGAQAVSLSQELEVRPGDTLRTGRNGRVLLKRGEETILVAPNSSIAIPSQPAEGLSTTIIQQAGSILLEVEKRNVKHFEVETPYLAAVVKGTQFRVSVDATGTKVSVLRGQVQVADFKSGQIAQVMPGQGAAALVHGKAGLLLSGSGTFSPVEQGKPRPTSTERLPVPKHGLTAPREAANSLSVRALADSKTTPGPSAARPVAAQVSGMATAGSTNQQGSSSGSKNVSAGGNARPSSQLASRPSLRISAPIGDIRLNVNKVTNGLARDGSATARAGHRTASSGTIWSPDAKTGVPVTVSDQRASGSPMPNASNVAAAAATPVRTQPGSDGEQTPIAQNDPSSGRGNSGAAGNGYGTRVGAANGNGNGHSGGNGNNGNGNGNNGNGRGNGNNGNAYGHAKN